MRLRIPQRFGIIAAVGVTPALAGCAPATPGAVASPGVQTSSSAAPAAGGSSGTGTLELDVEISNQSVISEQYQSAAGRIAVAEELAGALK